LAAAVGLLLVGRGADWLSDRKGREYHLAIYLAVLAVAVPISILAFTTQSPTIFMICFMGLQLIGLIGAVILFPVLQDAVPPHLRGRVIGLYLMLSTLIGYSLGPLSIALATDYLFRDEGAVGYSMALLAAVGFPLAIVVLNLARHPIRAVTVTCGMRDPNVGQ
jgi:MFS family permease